MLLFNLHIFEDQIVNADEAVDWLRKSQDDEVILDIGIEGPSLTQCGLIELVQASGKDFKQVQINTPNQYEILPFKFSNPVPWYLPWFSSCRTASLKYKVSDILGQHYRLGCFIGRKNLDRLSILYWISRRHTVFLSSLRDDHIKCEQRPDIAQWVDNVFSFNNWVTNFNIPSVDNFTVEDQYGERDKDGNHNNMLEVQLNMLRYYSQFDVELVCETFVRGETFFPTEKTVRPIMGEKPFLMYGPKNYLANLRNLGFQTWETCWDESYDQYEGIERWERMKQVIDQISFWGEWEWKPIIQKANEIAKHNYQHYIKSVPVVR